MASSLGVNVGNASSDAIYPRLYPELFASTAFLVSLLDVEVTTLKGDVKTDYYSYIDNYQKHNPLTAPLRLTVKWVRSMFAKETASIPGVGGKRFDPFHLSRKTSDILQDVADNISCTYSRTTDVVTITVKDQDPMVCALLADSIKAHLQTFITEYRTKKARVDYEHYRRLTIEARASYDKARHAYASYADAHSGVNMQSVSSRITDLENDMQLKYNIYSSMTIREQQAQADLQARTPVFTTLTNATVPVKPAGPKRMLFVAVMLMLATIVTIGYLFRKELREWL
jgi:uncharacterized protein involved in exopolysaccharide biosynthesis